MNRFDLTLYLRRWRGLGRPARLYLLHAALLTASLAIPGLFFNLAIEAFGYSRTFLGWLDTAAIGVAALGSLPLWLLVTRLGLRQAMLLSVLLQAASVFIYALWPTPAPLVLAVALTGAAAVLFQVSSPPFMMQHTGVDDRDHLFSANAGINVGVAGLASLLAGPLPRLFAGWLGFAPESGPSYQATFMVAGVGLLLSAIPLLLLERDAPAAPVPKPAPLAAEGPVQPGGTVATASERRNLRLFRTLGGKESAVSGQPAAPGGWLSDLLARIPQPYAGMLRQPRPLLSLLVSPFLISWGAALLVRYLNLFFKDRFGVSDDMLGGIFAALSLTTGLALLLGPVLSMRIGKIRTVVLTQALSIPFLLTLGFAPVLELAVAAALARNALFNMGTPLYDAFAMEQVEERARPVVIGIINGAYTAGYLVAPLISTRIQERYGFAPLFGATAVFYVLAIMANYWLFVAPRGRRMPAVTPNT